jgi:hypothetical protein
MYGVAFTTEAHAKRRIQGNGDWRGFLSENLKKSVFREMAGKKAKNASGVSDFSRELVSSSHAAGVSRIAKCPWLVQAVRYVGSSQAGKSSMRGTWPAWLISG